MTEDNMKERRVHCIHCFEKVFPSFIKWKVYSWVTGFLILGLISSLSYTARVSGQQDTLAKETDVTSLSETVSKIGLKQVEVVTNQNNIIKNQKDITDHQKEIQEKQIEMDKKLDRILEKVK